MTAGRVVLWRHGQTDYNLGGRLQGQVDIPLNATGREQAEQAAQVVAGFAPARIVASDLQRAAETAGVLAGIVGLDVTVDPRLRERSFGAWEGLLHAEIFAGWPELALAWRRGEPLVGIDAEQRAEVGERFAAAMAEHTAGLAGDDTLVVVAHGACIALGITALLGLDAESWAGVRGIGNCHWSVLDHTGRQPPWRLEAHNIAALP